MPDFNDFLKALKDNLVELAKAEFADYRDQVLSDGTAFAEKAKNDLKRWSEELLDGSLSKTDFEALVKGKSDLAEMEALKLAGLTQVRIDKVKGRVLDTVIGTAFKLFL